MYHTATSSYGEVSDSLKNSQSFDKIITLTYFLMDNFCPCLNVDSGIMCKMNITNIFV